MSIQGIQLFVEAFKVFPVLAGLLASGVCLLSSRQDMANGHRGQAIFWQVAALWVMIASIAAMIIYRMWFNLIVALSALIFERWLAQRWWGRNSNASDNGLAGH